MYVVSAHDLPWKSRRCWKEAIFLLLDVCKDLGAETGLVFCFQEWIQHSQVDGDTHEIEQFDEAVENSQRSNRENADIPALNPLVEVNRKPSTDWLFSPFTDVTLKWIPSLSWPGFHKINGIKRKRACRIRMRGMYWYWVRSKWIYSYPLGYRCVSLVSQNYLLAGS